MLEAGHHSELETTEIPDPLEVTGLRKLWTLALPAVALSGASAVVFVAVLAFLMHDREMQELFVLPDHKGFVVSLVAALLSWGIVFACRRRPGRSWPRWWCLFLAVANTALCILPVWVRESSRLDALAMAGLAAAVTLLPRLFKVRPDSVWVQRGAPLSLLLVLGVVLPGVGWTGQGIVSRKKADVEGAIDQLRLWTTEVQEVSRYDWNRLEAETAAASETVDRLDPVQPKDLLRNSQLWQEAAILGMDDKLSDAASDLADAAVAGLHPERVSRVSLFREPAFFWDPATRRWQAGLRFPAASEVVERYHQEVKRIFDEIEPGQQAPASRAWIDLKQHYSSAKETLTQHLQAQAGRWTDGWVVYELLGRSKPPLVDLFQTSLTGDGEDVLRPADLPRLMEITVRDVEERRRLKDCRDTGRYYHDSREYLRVDCYSYLPRQNGAGAELRAEMRLVYQAHCYYCSLSSYQSPVEIYFLFPIPRGTDPGRYRREVMVDLGNAVRSASAASFSYQDLSGSAASGFRVGRNIVVMPTPSEEEIVDHRALVVRAWRR